MIELNNDLLNKYLDGDLDKETMLKIKTQLELSPLDMKKYNELLTIHNELRKIPFEEVSPDFTSNLMLKVQRSLKSKREQNFFIVSVLSLFFLICLGIIGFFIASFVVTSEPTQGDTITQLTNHSEDLINLLSSFFSKGNISIIGSIFSFILLITGYFFYDSLKHSKQR